MVLVDYSIRREICHDDSSLEDQRLRLLMDENISNFCPRLRQAVSRLSRHRVGPLKQLVHLSDFQSSNSFLMPTGPNKSTQSPRYDMFVLSLPYLDEEISTTVNRNYMVRWSIIAQCGLPHRAPEVILLGMDNLSVVMGHKKSTPNQSRNNQRSQHQTDITFQETYWQQFVANESFHLQCLTKWEKLNTETNASLQYCLLADQLYDCYANFQLYKLKMSLKSPLMIHPPAHLIQAHTQYKQLVKLSKSSMSEPHPTDINVELFMDLDTVNKNEFEDRNHKNSSVVRLRAIVKLLIYEQIQQSLPLLTGSCIDDSQSYLVSVTATFAFNGTSNKNNNVDNLKNKNYLVRILNPKLSSTTKQGALFIKTMDSLTNGLTMLHSTDFVTFVNKVQNAAISAIVSYGGQKINEESKLDDSAKFLFEMLFQKFCNSSPNGNCLLDYRVSDSTNQDTTSFIRILLVDKSSIIDNNYLKYILSVEFKKGKTGNKGTNKRLFPFIALRSVYDDNMYEHVLDIKIPDNIIETDKNELTKMVEAAIINGMKQLKNKILIPALIQYKREQSFLNIG
ncbi:Hypothetical protein CINCED_3A019095 [Cinara cedri]|uniref:Uncharacterized protein n=1 Tax=Cinara cedri TaxID=506608 RepID=A0A5E4MZS6_9HEMI|nr:Hypothetical protein CINCED_3A019095 [Cinara cedri]